MGVLTRFVLAAAAVLMIAMDSSADPIRTRGGQCYGARWVQARETDCDRVCRRISMSAESMTLSSASQQRIFVCRHKGRTSYAFGEQGSRNCRIVDGGKPRKRASYECLCVRSGCAAEKPDRPERMSEADCLRRLEEAARRMQNRPSREAYARARRFCARGDLRSAVRALKP